MNVDGNMISLSDYPDAKGYIVVFTCNYCPYSQAYEDRLISLNETYLAKGYPVIAINPNDPELQPEDSFEEMKDHAKQEGFTFPYLFDEGSVAVLFGADKTPYAFVLEKTSLGNKVRYIGAIDDNHADVTAVKNNYVIDAVDTLLLEGDVQVPYTNVIGSDIVIKKK
jgi:glutathione peroxidase-family protein